MPRSTKSRASSMGVARSAAGQARARANMAKRKARKRTTTAPSTTGRKAAYKARGVKGYMGH